MRVRTITYAKLRKVRNFENDRVETCIELEPGDVVDDAIAEAKRICDRALLLDPMAAPLASRNDRRPPSDTPYTKAQRDRPIELYDEPFPGDP